MILIAVLYALCAATFTISKDVLSYAAPIFFVGIRMLTGGALLMSSYRSMYTVQGIRELIKRDGWIFAQIVVFHIYLAYVCDLWSLQYITSIESAVLFSLSPFAAALLSYLWFAERMTFKKWVGFGLGMTSLAPLVYQASQAGIQISGVTPIMAVLVSVISGSYGWVLMRELVANRGYSPVYVNGFGMIGGGILALLTSLSTETWNPFPVYNTTSFLGLTALIILVANVGFKNLYGYLLNYYTATFISFAGFTCPFFAALFGWWFLDEPITTNVIYAVCVVTLGLTMFYQEELRQGYIKR